jgi:hypothetical protein
MSVTITPNLQEKIDFFASMTSISSVEIDNTPIEYSQLIDNVECFMFKLFKDEHFIELVIPKIFCSQPLPQEVIQNKNQLDMLMEGYLNKKSCIDDDCTLCVNTNYLDSFYYLHPESDIIEQIHKATHITEKTVAQVQLVEKINELEFVENIKLYNNNIPDYIIVDCEFKHTNNADIYTKYTGTYPIEACEDVEQHFKIVEKIKEYYDNTMPKTLEEHTNILPL